MPTALVTGGSRGVGRGIATALSERGYRVYATGRSIASTNNLPQGVTRIPCDHLRDEQTAAVFRQIASEVDALDVLVNSAWGGYERMVEDGTYTWPLPFWEQPTHRWTSMMDAGVRSTFMASAHAARMMVPKRSGLIVNISYWAARKYIGNAIYGAAKAATDKLSADMAHELLAHGIAVISLYPGLVRTEAVMEAAKAGWLDISNSESPEFVGRVIAAFAEHSSALNCSGQTLVAAALAQELGIKDGNERQPEPLTLETA
jgi:dehydrogenase/reductase SDR family member 1